MILSRENQKIQDQVEAQKEFQLATKLRNKSCYWKFIRETVGISKTKYNELRKKLKVEAQLFHQQAIQLLHNHFQNQFLIDRIILASNNLL